MPPFSPLEESFNLLVEILEPRIAPTGLTGLANSIENASDPRYLAYNITPVPGVRLGFTPAGADGVFSIQLSGDGIQNGSGGFPNGDKIVIFSSTGGFNFDRPFLQATDNQILAFFRDGNRDGQVQTNELVGLSMGNASGAVVNGTVNGDVVANLGGNGFALVNDGRTSGNSIVRLNVTTGDVTGSIVAGGGLSNINVANQVGSLLAGSAANGFVHNFGGVTGTYAVAGTPDFQPGAGIVNATVGSLNSAISGVGGFGAPGGPIQTLVVNADTNGFRVESGAGGPGFGEVRGAAGGLISNLTAGLRGSLNDATAHDPITILGGAGGAAPDGRKSGNGGSLDNVAIGFNLDGNGNRQPTTFLLNDNVILQGGVGGAGFKAGTGGAVTNSLVLVGTPDNANFATDPAVVQILGGDGGAQTTGGLGGRGGKGGRIAGVNAQDLNTDTSPGPDATNAQLLVAAGDGGPVRDGGGGKFGGSVDGVTLLGYRLSVTAGDGAPGRGVGGAGGSVANVSVLSRSDLLPTELIVDAGRGARADDGSGGAGGNVANVRVANSNFTNFLINSGTHGDGGEAQGGAGGLGGNGGSVADVLVSGSRLFLNPDNTRVLPGVVILRAGDGAIGPNGGGDGGSISGVTVVGANFGFQVLAGDGGVAFANGDGGDGGALNNVGISNQPQPLSQNLISALLASPSNTGGLVVAGNGGAGAGTDGFGGNGGGLTGVNLIVTRSATLTAGDGGAAPNGAAGAGGSITKAAVQALLGSVTAQAGDAGPFGALPGNGGVVDGVVADAGRLLANGATGVTVDFRVSPTVGNILITAGNGAAGGAGGSVLNSGSPSLNIGSVTVQAGSGSGQNAVAGAGGSISAFTGFIGAFGSTRFVAGAGGNGNGAAGAGGAITAVVLNGAGVNVPGSAFNPAPGSVPQALTFDAGQGGDVGGGRKGGTGGSITNVTVSNLANNTVLHHFAAGDGGGGQVKSGRGGSLSTLRVGLPGERADIGLRSGAVYGYSDAQNPANGAFTNAGGLFAGAGGRSAEGRPLKPGSVTDVTAAAISSIVAGKLPSPQLANNVDRIFLQGLDGTTVNAIGDFTNFTTANLVGSVVNPAPGGGGATFKFTNVTGDASFGPGDVPLDGLIAAINLTQGRNFSPEAALLFDVNSNTVQFVDPR